MLFQIVTVYFKALGLFIISENIDCTNFNLLPYKNTKINSPSLKDRAIDYNFKILYFDHKQNVIYLKSTSPPLDLLTFLDLGFPNILTCPPLLASAAISLVTFRLMYPPDETSALQVSVLKSWAFT
jgi:hypothetical protein